jgi:hypothetical protein
MPCVAGEQRCDDTNNFLEIDGFTCPGGETIGPQVQQEPVPNFLCKMAPKYQLISTSFRECFISFAMTSIALVFFQ